jgi:hypothetical protein
VAAAIQSLVAARLGRGFLPAGLLFVVGFVELAAPIFRGAPGASAPSRGLVLAVGARASAAALLARGQRVVQTAFGHPARPWMRLARWGDVVPLLYGLYVLGWRGLREFAVGGDLAGAALGIVFALLGTWILRSWMRIVEVEQLARHMTLGLEGRGEKA